METPKENRYKANNKQAAIGERKSKNPKKLFDVLRIKGSFFFFLQWFATVPFRHILIFYKQCLRHYYIERNHPRTSFGPLQ